jgi:hypothetical protein
VPLRRQIPQAGSQRAVGMLSRVVEAGSAHPFEQRFPHFRDWAGPARHIPGKLGAANRTEAVAGPRPLGLIP